MVLLLTSSKSEERIFDEVTLDIAGVTNGRCVFVLDGFIYF